MTLPLPAHFLHVAYPLNILAVGTAVKGLRRQETAALLAALGVTLWRVFVASAEVQVGGTSSLGPAHCLTPEGFRLHILCPRLVELQAVSLAWASTLSGRQMLSAVTGKPEVQPVARGWLSPVTRNIDVD